MSAASAPAPRSACGPSPADWIRRAPDQAALERIEAFFSGHAYDPHRHDTYAIGVTLHGTQSFDYRGARADSHAGQVMILHPDERHNGRAASEGGFRYRMLYVQPAAVAAALGEGGAALPFVAAAVSENLAVKAALRLALADLDHPLEELEADRFLVALADALAQLDPSIGRPRPLPPAQRAVALARDYLDAHLGVTVRSDALEAASGLDRFTLARQFRQRFGTSPYRYLTMRRLDRAKAEMHAGLSLAEAAIAAGFSDQSHFTRHFRAAFGVAPGRWQALHRRAPPA